MAIVPTDQNYGYFILRQNILLLNCAYPFLNVQIVGNSVLGKNIYVIKLGKGSKKVFYSASLHANEWITSVLLMKFVEDYCVAYDNNSTLYGYSVKDLFNNASIYIMPMVNPDGVDLVTGFLSPNSLAFELANDISNQFPDIPFVNRLESKYKWCGFFQLPLIFYNVTLKVLLCIPFILSIFINKQVSFFCNLI